jgi:hypothetical protein
MPRNWWSRLAHNTKHPSRPGAPRKRSLRLESLEERLAPAHLSYQGGPVLPSAAVTTVYYGDWSSVPQGTTTNLNKFFSTITNSAYMDFLGQYSVTQQTPGYAGTPYHIGRGSFAGSLAVSASLGGNVEDHNQPAQGIVDANNIQDMLASQLQQGKLTASANSLFVVFTDPNTEVHYHYVPDGGQLTDSNSVKDFMGYHNTFDDNGQSVAYAVLPYPGKASDLGSASDPANLGLSQLTVFQNLTRTASHELAEAVTDPAPETGWVDPNSPVEVGHEIADLAANQDLNPAPGAEGGGYDYGVLDGYVVQYLFANSYTPPGGQTVTDTPVLPVEGAGTPDPSSLAITSIKAPTEGTFSGVIATFAEGDGNTDPSQYSSMIHWGEGDDSAGTISFNKSTGEFEISGSHTFTTLAGTDLDMAVSVTDNDGGAAQLAQRVTEAPKPVFHWTGQGPDSNWSDGQNWDQGKAPGATDDVLIGQGQVTLDVPATVDNLTLSGGTITGSADLTINGALNWTGGTMSGSGQTFANGPVTIDTSSGGVTLDGRTFVNAGTATVTGSGSVLGSDGAVWSNLVSARLEFHSDAGLALTGTGGAQVNNSGGLGKVEGTGVSAIAWSVTNNAVIAVQSGTLRIGSLSNLSGTTLTDGDYVAQQGTLELTGASIQTDAASIQLYGAAAQITDGSGHDVLAGLTSIADGADLGLYQGSTLAVAGAFTNAGYLVIDKGSTFTASAGYTQSGNGGTTLAGGTLAAGTVTLNGGSLDGVGTVAGNVINGTVPSAPVSASKGKVGFDSGAGTTPVAVVNPGSASTSTGFLTIQGNYTQTATGALSLFLGGTTAGTGYDQLVVTGTANLGGTLNVGLLNNGFTPGVGDSYLVIKVGSQSGGFATTNGLTLGGGLVLSPQTTATAFTLDALAQTTTTETPSPVSPVFGQQFSLMATVGSAVAGAPTPTGTVTFMDGSTPLGSATIKNGSASFSTKSLTVGSHNITAVYGGDSNFVGSTSTVLTQAVSQDGATVTLSPTSAVTIGQSVTFTATVGAAAPGAGAPGGTVTFMDGSTPLGSGTIMNGKASFSTTSLTAGSHSITAVYGGDGNFTTTSSQPVTQTVNKIGTTIILSPLGGTVFGQQATFTATVSPVSGNGTPSGSVTFMDGNNLLGGGILTNSTASFNTFTLSVGSHHITAVYSGDATYARSSSAAQTQTVGKDAATVTLSPTSPVTAGHSVTLTANVAAATSTPASPGGTVTFMDGSTPLGTAPIKNGSASFSTTSLVVGAHSITAVFGGDFTFKTATSPAVTQVVNPAAKAGTTTTISGPATTTFGKATTFTASVNGTGSGTPGGTVTFMDGSTPLGSAPLKNGTASFTLTAPLNVGTHKITAAYSGDGAFAAGTSAALPVSVGKGATTTTLGKVLPGVFGQSMIFQVKVVLAKPAGGSLVAVPSSYLNGTVTFMDGKNVLGTAPLKDGGASFATAALSVGTHSITAVFGGSGNLAGSTSAAASQVINKDAATVTLLPLSPAGVGQPVTFTATVGAAFPGKGNPGGTVTFLEGTKVLGTGTIKNGSASFTTSSLALGSHSIKAVYGGDGNFANGSSAVLTQVIKHSATVTLTSTGTTVYGQKVSFSVKVKATQPGTGSPGGTVTFMDGSTVLSTVKLKNGTATWSTSALTGGNHTITAFYNGDSTFGGSTAKLTQTVNRATVLMQGTAPTHGLVNGRPVMVFGVTVKTVAPGAGVPVGTVVLSEGGKTLGLLALDASGRVTFIVSGLTKGTHSISASYSGNANFLPSVAMLFKLTV